MYMALVLVFFFYTNYSFSLEEYLIRRGLGGVGLDEWRKTNPRKFY